MYAKASRLKPGEGLGLIDAAKCRFIYSRSNAGYGISAIFSREITGQSFGLVHSGRDVAALPVR